MCSISTSFDPTFFTSFRYEKVNSYKPFPRDDMLHFPNEVQWAPSLAHTFTTVWGMELLSHKILPWMLCLQALNQILYSSYEIEMETQLSFIHGARNWLCGMLQKFFSVSMKDLLVFVALAVSWSFECFFWVVQGMLVYGNNSCGCIVVIVEKKEEENFWSTMFLTFLELQMCWNSIRKKISILVKTHSKMN